MSSSASLTPSTAAGNWQALHIHLPHSWQTRFLAESVRPLLDTVAIDRFFFLRYWQGGPHLRLRLDGAGQDTVETARRTLAAALPTLDAQLAQEYTDYANHQSTVAEIEGAAAQQVRPPGSIEVADYVPEYGKYGGPAGMPIAERVFSAMSAVVLELLPTLAERGTNALTGQAIRIMAMSLRGSGLDVPQTLDFLESYERFWRVFVPAGADEQWPAHFAKTHHAIRALCVSVWQDGKTDAVHDIYARARAEMQAATGMASDADPGQMRLGETDYTRCLLHYIHTTNNRLGVVPAVEAFLAYTMRRALAEPASG